MSRDPFPVDHPVIAGLVTLGAGWRGTASQLWAHLEGLGVEDLPVDGQRLANRLRASSGAVEDVGLRLRRSRVKGERMLTLDAVEPVVTVVPEAASSVPPAGAGASHRARTGRDRIAPWSVGRRVCPECGTDVDDLVLVANRRADGAKWYPEAHTIRACRYEAARLRQLEEAVDRAERRPWGPWTGQQVARHDWW